MTDYRRDVDDERVTVFLLDDHEVVRRGLRDLLEAEGIDVVGEAATAEEAFGRIHALDPDVAVLDVRLPDGDGVTVCREVRSRHPRTALSVPSVCQATHTTLHRY